MNLNFPLKPIANSFIIMTLSSLFALPVLAQEKALNLTTQQQENLGIEIQAAKAVAQIPSANYPAQGIVAYNQAYLVSAPLTGQITKIHFVHGSIEKGQVIAELQSPELLNLQKDFLNTLTDLSAMQVEFERAQTLNKNGVVSNKKLQQLAASVQKLEQERHQKKQDLAFMGMENAAIDRLEKTKTLQPAKIQIKAPVSGELFDIQAKIGQRLSANEPIISVGIIDPMIVEIRVPVPLANQLKEGDAMQLNHPLEQGKIAHIDHFTDPMTQTVEVHGRFANHDKRLKPGQLFSITFLHPPQNDEAVYMTSAKAITQLEGQDTLFTLQQNQALVPLAIKVYNIKNGQLYFSPKTPISVALDGFKVVTKGTMAVKLAYEGLEGEE